MGLAQPQLLLGHVMHGRLFPKQNRFRYPIYYMVLPLDQLPHMALAYNQPAKLSFYDDDHGHRDGSDLTAWATAILADYDIGCQVANMTLITMPRVLGYVFNPVSFWLCYDQQQQLRAVLCEVNNTFGERHTYLCCHQDKRPIKTGDSLLGDKVFHVSPMLAREGHYRFRFSIATDTVAIDIDYYDGNGDKQLVTSLSGLLQPMSQQSLNRAFWRYPLLTLKVMALIHWQALKLISRGIGYTPKPKQQPKNISATHDVSRNSS